MESAEVVLTYALPEREENTWSDVGRRAALWTALCSVSAAPSMFWATRLYSGHFNVHAMICGIALFIAGYTVMTSTQQFLRFRRRPFVRRTLYIGYGTRVVLTLLFPLGLGFDLFPGMISIRIVQTLLEPFGGGDPEAFADTLLITIVQGTILNVLLSLYMLVVWAIQRLFFKPPAEPHGFPVEFVRREVGAGESGRDSMGIKG